MTAEASELNDQILEFVSRRLGIKRSTIKIDSELNNDLGMDGDDAVDFFDAFTKRFTVDLDELSIHWDEHFVAEGGGSGLGFMILAGAAAIVSGLLHAAFPAIPGWIFCGAISLLSVVGYFYFAGRNSTKASGITVQDLVDAAKAHRWIKPYNSDPRIISGYEL
ncbi:MAG TPA: DUF1493 family protein [Terriglobales bacterium]|nr:DUF1493 family protein [Terriglobales bacterium]